MNDPWTRTPALGICCAALYQVGPPYVSGEELGVTSTYCDIKCSVDAARTNQAGALLVSVSVISCGRAVSVISCGRAAFVFRLRA